MTFTAIFTVCAIGAASSQPVNDTRARERQVFNNAAAELAVPLFWAADDNDKLEPDELAHLLMIDGSDRGDWITADGQYTALAKQAFSKIARYEAVAPADDPRRKAVLEELRQAQPALLTTDMRGANEEDRAFVKAMVDVAKALDALYMKQIGAAELEPLIADPASRALFMRNHGPWCVQPATEKNKQCNAIDTLPAQASALYPTALQAKPGFCEGLLKHQYARALLHPFSVVRGDGDALKPVPYHIIFASEMDAVSVALKRAADTLKSDGEQPMHAYLHAAAQAFRDNQWTAADEPWVKTGGGASKWYVRIAADEAYADLLPQSCFPTELRPHQPEARRMAKEAGAHAANDGRSRRQARGTSLQDPPSRVSFAGLHRHHCQRWRRAPADRCDHGSEPTFVWTHRGRRTSAHRRHDQRIHGSRQPGAATRASRECLLRERDRRVARKMPRRIS